MGASSVTGIGQGVAANLKGPGNNRSFSVPEVCPHIVAAGSTTTSSATPGVMAVYLPHIMPKSMTEYSVMVTLANQATAAAHDVTVVKHDTGSKFDYFTIYSEVASEAVDWVVVTHGFGLDVCKTTGDA